jgi:hypothetical protein
MFHFLPLYLQSVRQVIITYISDDLDNLTRSQALGGGGGQWRGNHCFIVTTETAVYEFEHYTEKELGFYIQNK